MLINIDTSLTGVYNATSEGVLLGGGREVYKKIGSEHMIGNIIHLVIYD